MSLQEARAKALRNRKAVLDGLDPRKPQGMTFAEASDRKLAERLREWKPTSKEPQAWAMTMKEYVYPVIGELGVGEVKGSHVKQVLMPLVLDAKHSQVSRVAERISSVLRWATVEGYRTIANPVSDVVAELPKRRQCKTLHHAAIPHADLGVVAKAVDATNILQSTKMAFRFLCLTACRTGEVLGATWDEIDFESATWTIPGERMKNGAEHRVPLSNASIKVLTAAGKRSSGDLVFPGRNGRLAERAIRNALGSAGREGMTGHGIRSSFMDWAVAEGVPFDVRERCLAHSERSRTVAAYARTDLLEERREVMERWADYVAATAKPKTKGLDQFFEAA